MHKKFFAFIGAFLAVGVTFLSVSVIPGYAAEKADEKQRVNEEISVNAYQKLNVYLSDKNTEARTAVLSDTENHTSDLSTVYAGAYINDDGILTVNITETSKDIQDELAQATDNAPVQYKIVEKNLAELQEVYGILSAHLRKRPILRSYCQKQKILLKCIQKKA